MNRRENYPKRQNDPIRSSIRLKNLLGFIFLSLAIFAVVVSISTANASGASSVDDVEKGRVDWSRDLEQAKQASAKSGKPLLVLFQEIPG